MSFWSIDKGLHHMSLLSLLEQQWVRLSQAAVFLAGLVFVFIATPPAISISEPISTTSYLIAEFVLAVLIAFILIASMRFRQKAHVRHWVLAASVALVVGTSLFATYHVLYRTWTCTYASGITLIIGPMRDSETLRTIPEDWGCTELLTKAGGLTTRIWPREILVNRQLVLEAIFVPAVIFLALSVILAIQALYCAGVVRKQELT